MSKNKYSFFSFHQLFMFSERVTLQVFTIQSIVSGQKSANSVVYGRELLTIKL